MHWIIAQPDVLFAGLQSAFHPIALPLHERQSGDGRIGRGIAQAVFDLGRGLDFPAHDPVLLPGLRFLSIHQPDPLMQNLHPQRAFRTVPHWQARRIDALTFQVKASLTAVSLSQRQAVQTLGHRPTPFSMARLVRWAFNEHFLKKIRTPKAATKWLLYADNPLALLRRNFRGSFMPPSKWLHIAASSHKEQNQAGPVGGGGQGVVQDHLHPW